MPNNALQTTDPAASDNALAQAPSWYDAPPDDYGRPMQISPLAQWLAAQRAKSNSRGPVWPMSNPVGTETTQSMQTATPIDQIAFMRSDGTPVMASDMAAAHQAVQTAQQVAPTMVLGMMGTTNFRGRPVRVPDVPEFSAAPSAAPPPAPYGATDAPAPFGIGHNDPPVRSAIWAAPQTRGAVTAQAGRLGTNADQTLEALGLPAYKDIVPSTNTGPVPESMIQQGSPVRPGQVFDLSDTWRVPDVRGAGVETGAVPQP